MVGRIREVLRFKAESRPQSILDAVPARECSIKEVAGIELNARLRCLDCHFAAALRISNDGGHTQRTGVAIEHPVVIVAAAELQLLVVVVNPRSDHFRLAKIKRRARHRGNAGRNQVGVHRRVLVGIDLDLVVENRAIVIAIQVEIGVVGDVDREWLCLRYRCSQAAACCPPACTLPLPSGCLGSPCRRRGSRE